MNKKISKFLTVSIALTMVVSMSGFNLKKTQTADPFGKYTTPITLTSVKQTTTAYKYPKGDDINNNVWTREIKNTLGIDLKYNWTIDDPTQYKNKLNISIASGDLPDFFACDGATFTNLAKNGLIADLTGVYNKYASANLKAEYNSFIEGYSSGKVNGKLMGLSNLGYGLMATTYVVWIREDWRQKANLPAPKTMADVENMAKVFMKNNPGAYGIALNKTMYDDLENIKGIANGYHAYPTIWVKNAAGKLVYGSLQPEMKTALKAMQGWFKSGIISNEFGVKDTDKVNTDLVSGKVGIEFGANWNGYWPFPDLVKKDTNAIFKPYAIPSSDGKAVQLQSNWPADTYYVVNKNCKNPEAIIKLANLQNKIQYHGTEAQIATLVSSEAGNISPIVISDPNNDYKIHNRLVSAIAKNSSVGLATSEKMEYDSIMSWINKKNPDGYGAWAQTSKDGAYAVLKKAFDSKQILLTAIHGANTPLMAEKGATLLKLETDDFMKIIMGGDVDSTFNSFVADWKKLGGDDITKEVNDIYNKK